MVIAGIRRMVRGKVNRMEIAGVDKRTPVKSWQGEGPYAGERIVVLRFMGCNMKCHWRNNTGGLSWCDTKWTWDGSERGEVWGVDKLVDRVWKEACKHLALAPWETKAFATYKRAKIVMVTGGEPMLRQDSEAFHKLIEGLKAKGLKIHFETNGSKPPNEWARKNIDFFDMSPKYQLYPSEYTIEKVKAWQNCGVQVAWKFVVGTQADVYDLRDWVESMMLPKDADIWLMPLTNDDKSMDEALQLLKAGVVKAFQETYLAFKKVHISPRLQITGGFP
jgi:organic radical activating enzyme